ncbi:hypothetical protein ITI46_15175 [Streptomyces oryzae]|uniref:Uncharacterized protein n=1 Tax=Streptomyces oryzae TaxID=1434886 RepID=A0ABS3XD80_9ACTN|nr:hypothetical protein [Streptomyces oryzae]
MVFGVFLLVAVALITRWTMKPPNLHPRRYGRQPPGAPYTGHPWTAGEDAGPASSGGGASCGSGASCGGGGGGI